MENVQGAGSSSAPFGVDYGIPWPLLRALWGAVETEVRAVLGLSL